MANSKVATGIVVPTLDSVAAPRGYNAFAAPATPQAAAAMLQGAPGTRGLLQEWRQAQHRVANNVARYGATSGRVATDIGWYDRTTAKVLACYAVLATAKGAGSGGIVATAQGQATSVLAQAQALTGFGTAKAQSAAGKAHYVQVQSAKPAPAPRKAAPRGTGDPAIKAHAAAQTARLQALANAKPVARKAQPTAQPTPAPTVRSA